MDEFVYSTEGAEVNSQENTEGQVKTYTQEELDALLQAEADRRVSQAIETARTKWDEKKTAELERVRAEAERTALMTVDQRAEHERKIREEQLTAREVQILRRELRAQAYETLAQRGLPMELIEAVNYADAESCNASIDTLEGAFRCAVETAVGQRLAGQTPRGGRAVNKAVTHDEFKGMGYSERAELFAAEPEVYAVLSAEGL